MYRAKERLYLSTDGRIVTGSSPEDCEKLFKVYGQQITEEEMQRYKGRIEKHVIGYQPPRPKKKSKPKENKMISPESDKADADG